MLLLLTAAVATWTAAWNVRQENEQLRSEISEMQRVARELVVLDEAQMALVKDEEQWYGEDSWQIYLPPGREYRLLLATREIPQIMRKPAKPMARNTITPGRHQIRLQEHKRDDGWLIEVTVDETTVIRHPESADWQPKDRSTSSLGPVIETQQYSLDQPLVLEHDRFFAQRKGGVTRRSEDEPTNGLMLWVEAVQP